MVNGGWLMVNGGWLTMTAERRRCKIEQSLLQLLGSRQTVFPLISRRFGKAVAGISPAKRLPRSSVRQPCASRRIKAPCWSEAAPRCRTFLLSVLPLESLNCETCCDQIKCSGSGCFDGSMASFCGSKRPLRGRHSEALHIARPMSTENPASSCAQRLRLRLAGYDNLPGHHEPSRRSPMAWTDRGLH
jgi:hypothetical protein